MRKVTVEHEVYNFSELSDSIKNVVLCNTLEYILTWGSIPEPFKKVYVANEALQRCKPLMIATVLRDTECREFLETVCQNKAEYYKNGDFYYRNF